MATILMIKPTAKFSHRLLVSPPLGLMYLAAYAKIRRPGKDSFTLIDERTDPKSDREWKTYVSELRPDIIAFSVLTHESSRLKTLAAIFKKVLPDIPIVAGGPYISSWGAKVVDTLEVDYYVKGEGEVSFVKLLDALERKNNFPEDEISGLIYKNRDNLIVDNPVKIELPDVNELPFPSWELVDLDKYSKCERMSPMRSSGRYAAIFTSRGCPYGCIYCHNIFGKKFRAMNPKRTVDEIEHLITKYDIHDFEIVDDIFNHDYNRAMEICNEIKKRGLKTRFSFPNGIRGDTLDRKIIKELRSVGTYYMVFAVESANERVQKYIHKHVDLRRIRENIAIAVEEKITTGGFFMIGFPEETRKEIWNTLKFALFSRVHIGSFFTVIPQAGTKMAEMCGMQLETDDAYATHYQFSTSKLSEISHIELSLTHILSYFLFYFYPPRIIRILKDWPGSSSNLIWMFKEFLLFIFYRRPKYALSSLFKKR
jgi:anaerobic magnesium-protoporphyrin IX monomethyl ester cyclase